MNQVFSFKRVQALFSRYFLENGKKDITVFLIVTGVFILLSVLQTPIWGTFIMLLGIMGILYSSRIFGALGSTQKGMNYLLIPASSFEKLFVNWILTHFYYFIVLSCAYLVGGFIGQYAQALLFPTHLPNLGIHTSFASDFFHNLHMYLFQYMIVQSFFMFGSVYFKRRAVLKSLLCFFGFFVFIFLLTWFTLRVQIHPDYITYLSSLDGGRATILGAMSMVNRHDIYIIEAIVACFFWVLSYIRLRETEV